MRRGRGLAVGAVLWSGLNPHFQCEILSPNLWIVATLIIHAGLNAMETLRRPEPSGRDARPFFRLSANASLRVDFRGSRVTPDGGLILVRELDERLGLERLIGGRLSDSRQGLNKQFTLADLPP